MRWEVADRNRVDVNGITTRGAAIELRPPPSALFLMPRAGREPAKQVKWIPVTVSGAAQSSRPVCVAARERARQVLASCAGLNLAS